MICCFVPEKSLTITMVFDSILSFQVYLLIPDQAIPQKHINLPERFDEVGTIVCGYHHDFAFNLKLPVNTANFFG